MFKLCQYILKITAPLRFLRQYLGKLYCMYNNITIYFLWKCICYGNIFYGNIYSLGVDCFDVCKLVQLHVLDECWL